MQPDNGAKERTPLLLALDEMKAARENLNASFGTEHEHDAKVRMRDAIQEVNKLLKVDSITI